MNADAIRHFYNYHFSQNRAIWDRYIMPLSQEQFTHPTSYSVGSVCNQIVHLINVDNAWFHDFGGLDFSDMAPSDDRHAIRAYWDTVEEYMRQYLTALTDDMLLDKPLQGEDANLILWQALLHVANHGTDHRAQILRLLNDLGVNTGPQDYIFYVYDNP